MHLTLPLRTPWIHSRHIVRFTHRPRLLPPSTLTSGCLFVSQNLWISYHATYLRTSFSTTTITSTSTTTRRRRRRRRGSAAHPFDAAPSRASFSSKTLWLPLSPQKHLQPPSPSPQQQQQQQQGEEEAEGVAQDEGEHTEKTKHTCFDEFFSTSLPPRTLQASSQVHRLCEGESGGSASATILQNPSDHFYHNHVLEKYATKKCTKVTLRQLEVSARTMTDEKLLRSANFLKEEITIRFAHRICRFQALPYMVTSHPAFQHIYQSYWDTFSAFRTFPQIDMESHATFCTLVQHALDRHRATLPLLITATAKVSTLSTDIATATATATEDRSGGVLAALTPFLKQTIASQLGCRVLAHHHLAMAHRKVGAPPSPMVSQRMCVLPLLRAHGPAGCVEAPSPRFSDPTDAVPSGERWVTGVPALLRFIFASFLAGTPQSSVRITVCDAPHTVLVRLSDTYPDTNRCAFSLQPRSNIELRRALSKVCLEYFGGKLQCVPMEGYGTDMYIALDKEGNVPEALEEEVQYK